MSHTVIKRFVVFGNPISHSLSPQLHALFAKQFGMTIDYQKQLVALDQFKNAVDAFRATQGAGANITMPFKINAFEYADQLTSRAQLAGAVNTFIFKNDVCIGDNTDGVGLIRDLKNNHFNLHDKKILIIGAGGATRNILSNIIQEKPRNIFVMNRTIEKAKKLIHDFEKYFPLQLFSDEKHIDLIINATAIDFLSFHFNPDLSSTFCYDLNYGERHNTFLKWAQKNKAEKISDGLAMLIEQGAESFFQWTGKMPRHECAPYRDALL